MKKNVLIALGGGPSPVINASLAGVLTRMQDFNDVGEIYCAAHGVEGVLFEDLWDMRAQDPEELARLRRTPASGAVGTCRYKLRHGAHEDHERILAVLRAHNIGYFFYIGGNDSMDTADKVNTLAAEAGMALTVVGVPKTIDNDVGDEAFTIIDHTPGYGSAARYWANIIKEADEENRGMCVSERVCVLQAMGRKSGFITAAARLADPDREMPLQLYFAESGFGLAQLTDNVNDAIRKYGRCIVVVNEGFDAGDLGAARDGFGHIEYGASRSTVCQNVVNHLNSVHLAARGNVTGQVPGVLQRSCAVMRSRVDAEEAYLVGAHAAELAESGRSGVMATLLRKPGAAYAIYCSDVPLAVVANSERFLPKSWIAPGGVDVTDDFIRYAKPLIGDGPDEMEYENGILRFARLRETPVDKRLAPYVPENYR